MDESNKYLELEIEAIDAKIAEAMGLVFEFGDEAKLEVERLTKQKDELQKALVGEKSSEDEIEKDESFNSVIVEVRQGVGGDEAKIWADDLLRMYGRFAGFRGWKVEVLDEGVIKIKGKGSFDALKFETGVHRVQRVPETEAAGRIHTSTASVVVLPEVPESRIEIREDDLLWEFSRGGGHGGQNVNKVSTAVRLTHKPTGVVVQSRQERSQEQNRKIALELLRSQLWEREEEKKYSILSAQRSKIGRSMRSEKIRTYNYPQNRVTDHRIAKSWHKLDKIISGDLGDVVSSLSENDASGDNTGSDDEGNS